MYKYKHIIFTKIELNTYIIFTNTLLCLILAGLKDSQA